VKKKKNEIVVLIEVHIVFNIPVFIWWAFYETVE